MYFKILGVPFSKQSFRFTKSGLKYQPKAVKENTKSIQYQIISQLPKDFKPFTKGIIVKKLFFVFPILKSFSKKEKQKIKNGEIIYKITKPDLTDNLNKNFFDAMQGIVYLNDSQICYLKEVKKIYGEVPRIELEITKLKGDK